MKSFEAIVIGAGFAGLFAAKALHSIGISTIVLEARDRVGGRSHTMSDDTGTLFEQGAQWISPHQQRIQQLVRRYGLTVVQSQIKGQTIYDICGRRKLSRTNIPAIPLSGLIDIMLLRFKISRLLQKLSPTAPWQGNTGRMLDEMTMGEWLRRHVRTPSGFSCYKLLIEESFCAPIDEYSALDVLWNIKTAGSLSKLKSAEDQWIREGTQALAFAMAEELGDRVICKVAVDRIQVQTHGLLVHAGVKQWHAKRVIIAVPPVLIKQLKFEPPLPAVYQELANGINPGSIVKCRLTYSYPFWRDAGLSGFAYMDRGLAKFVADTTAPGQQGGSLTAFISGAEARKLTVNSEERRREVIASLVDLFGTSAATPLQFAEINWNDDPWSLGGFAGHAGTGLLSAYGEWIAAPIGPIHWAGTETATEWRSYLEGALQSGERAAAEVVKALRAEDRRT